MKEPGRCQYSD